MNNLDLFKVVCFFCAKEIITIQPPFGKIIFLIFPSILSNWKDRFLQTLDLKKMTAESGSFQIFLVSGSRALLFHQFFGGSFKCAMVKSRYIGDGHPTFIRNPYNGYINPYYWVDELSPIIWK